MKKHGEELFKIGEVIKILGVPRKALLIYEEMGLLTPAVKDEKSGYRYYSADNMTQIRSIRSLQSLGLTLKEINEYYYCVDHLEGQLQRLMELRAALDKNIQTLQLRLVKAGDLSVHKTTLPQQVCFCRRYQCRDTADAANNLRDTYIAAARTGKMSKIGRMFTMRMGQNADGLDILCCIPVEGDFDGPERMEFSETQALCVYHRGAYEGIPAAMQVLAAYVQEHSIEVTGQFRSVYMEGPPSRGDNSADYITQIAVPYRA